MKEQKWGKLLQYGQRVFGINEGSEAERIDKAIELTEQFFRSLRITTRLSEDNIGLDTIEKIAERFNERGFLLGEGKNIDGDITRSILLSVK